MEKELSLELCNAIAEAIIAKKELHGGSIDAYAKSLGISASIFSRLKKGERTNLIKPDKWLAIGRKLGVQIGTTTWRPVETDVYLEMQDDFSYCQQNAKALLLVDDCGIGKTYCARILIAKMHNAFYVDASQAKSKRLFIQALAREVGISTNATLAETLEDLRYYINALGGCFICIDEAGDLDYQAFLELKALINGTIGRCGWYMMGADGLRAKIQSGIKHRKVGYREIFDRFAARFRSITPDTKEERQAFYKKLFTDVAYQNLDDKNQLNAVIAKCYTKIDGQKTIPTDRSLRYLETLIKVAQQQNSNQ